ncbi:40737_t:CDS:1 [Gigaspora margarita]|uniref:40737_t:CDS:1 n=1 Tax=Gigaspora margarita TaxID=4874 RepID=A0ABN7UQD6_GIGMA|nr:40737_t:CDS:1 [Gigaspora margarita]
MNILTYQFTGKESEQLPILQPLMFQHLVKFKPTHNVKQLQGPKQRYGLGMGYTKKALDLAFRADRVEKFVSHLKNFIEVAKTDLFSMQDSTSIKDPLHISHKE